MNKSKRKFGVILITLIGIIISMILVKHFLFKLQYSFATEDIQPKIEACLDKYVNYNLSDQDKGTLVQYSVKTGINNAENIEFKESKVNINLNQIDNKYPFDVKVINKNSVSADSFYDSNTGDLLIIAENPNEEYFVICYYDTFIEDATEREIGFYINVIDVIANADSNEVSKDGTFNTTVTENISSLTSVNHSTDDIYNGYMKSNIINGTNYETDYKDTAEIMISKKEAQEELVLVDNNKLMQDDENEIYNNQNLVVKSTKVKKENLLNVLGEEGTLELLDLDENTLAVINKNTEFAEDGTYTINYESQPEGLIIKTSKVLNEGIISLENIKEIKPTYNNANKIKTINQLIGTTEDNQEKETILDIKNAESKVDLNINNEEWTNERQNEVVFDVLLNTNGSQYNLYKNPTIKIELPDEVEKVVLGDSSLLYGSGLELQNVNIEKNQNGNFVVTAKLSGAQTEYDINNLGLTTNIKIPLSIILKQDIESSEKDIIVYSSNGYTVDGSIENNSYNKNINIVDFRENKIAEEIINLENNELFSLASMNNVQASVNENLKLEVAPVKGENLLNDGDTVYEGEYIKYNIKVENTSDQDITNVKVVATIPEGVTYGELETDFNTSYGKYKYTFNEETREKTFILNTLKAGKSATIFFEVKANQLENEEEKEITATISSYIEDNKNEEIQIKNKIKAANTEVFMGAYNGYDDYHYFVNIKSDETKEVTANVHLPKDFYLISVMQIEENVEDIPSLKEIETGETVYKPADDYIVAEKSEDDEEYNEFIEGFKKDNNIIGLTISEDNIVTAKLKTNCFYEFRGNWYEIDKNNEKSELTYPAYTEIIDNSNTYTSNESRYTIYYSNVTITMSSDKEGEELQYGEEIEYDIKIDNISGTDWNVEDSENYLSVNVSDFLPTNVNPTTVEYYTWNLEREIINNEDEEFEDEDDIEEYGNEVGREEIIKLTKTDAITKDISTTYTKQDGTIDANVNVDIVIPSGETSILKVKATAGMVDTKTKIENNATVSGTGIEKVSNTIENTIAPYIIKTVEDEIYYGDEPNDQPSDSGKQGDNEGQNNPNNNNKREETYNISGLAWLDENKDGQRQSGEDTISGINVLLVDSKDATKEKATAKTNSQGIYQFTNIQEGNYLVIFEYDTNKYNLTEYQKSGINNSINSDATTKTITMDGKQTTVGITDMIKLDASVNNIDIGLIEKEACDFSVEKYISKVIVNTKKGTKTSTYDNEKLAKIEIRAKEIEGATVTIEYNIRITNNSGITGNIGQIVDTLPAGLVFSEKLNTGWVKGTNGEIINSSYANKAIKAGESIEIPLVATKQMNSDATGTFTNNVVIDDIFNVENTEDVNKNNNSSKADIIISVSTGAILYITVAFITLGVLTAMFYILNKKGKINLNKLNGIKFVVLVFTVIFGVMFSTNSNVYAGSATRRYSQKKNVTLTVDNKKMTDKIAKRCLAEIDAAIQNADKDPTDYRKLEDSKNWNYLRSAINTFSKYFDSVEVNIKYPGFWRSIKNNYEKAYYFAHKEPGSTLFKRYASVEGYRQNKKIMSWARCQDAGKSGWTYYAYLLKIKCRYVAGSRKETTTGFQGSNVKKTNSNISVTSLTENNIEYCKYGPFTFTATAMETYSLKEVKCNGKILTGSASICQKSKNGNTYTFYIKIPKSRCVNGVTSVSIKANGTTTTTVTRTYDVIAFYRNTKAKSEGDKYQDVTPILGENNNKALSFDGSIVIKGTRQANAKVTLTWTDFNTTVDITKVDKDTKEPLNGVKFKIKKENGKYIKINNKNEITGEEIVTTCSEVTDSKDSTTFITGDVTNNVKKGKVVLYNLPTGTYIITEIENTNYEYGNNINLSAKITPIKGQYKQLTLENEKAICDLVINKKDKDSGVALEGITFLLKQDNNGDGNFKYVRINNKNDITGEETVTELEQVDSAESATKLTTNAKGQIKLLNLIATKHKYEIEEISVGGKYDGYELDGNYIYYNDNTNAVGNNENNKPNSIPFTLSKGDASKNILNIYNRKKYIKISGNVWEDMLEREGEEKEGKINKILSDGDIKIQGIKVSLKEGKNVVDTKITDENGHYVFENVLIDELPNYYVEFEYDGEIYTTGQDYSELNVDTTESNVTISGNTEALQIIEEVEEANESNDTTQGGETQGDDNSTQGDNNATQSGEAQGNETSMPSIQNVPVTLKYKNGNIVKTSITTLIDVGGDTVYPWLNENQDTEESEETDVLKLVKTEERETTNPDGDGNFTFNTTIPSTDINNYYIKYTDGDTEELFELADFIESESDNITITGNIKNLLRDDDSDDSSSSITISSEANITLIERVVIKTTKLEDDRQFDFKLDQVIEEADQYNYYIEYTYKDDEGEIITTTIELGLVINDENNTSFNGKGKLPNEGEEVENITSGETLTLIKRNTRETLTPNTNTGAFTFGTKVPWADIKKYYLEYIDGNTDEIIELKDFITSGSGNITVTGNIKELLTGDSNSSMTINSGAKLILIQRETIATTYLSDNGEFDFKLEEAIQYADRNNYYIEYTYIIDSHGNTNSSIIELDTLLSDNPTLLSDNKYYGSGKLEFDDDDDSDTYIINPVKTDEEGDYYFTHVPCKNVLEASGMKLSDIYYVEFTYNGKKYRTTAPLEEIEGTTSAEVTVRGNILDEIYKASEDDEENPGSGTEVIGIDTTKPQTYTRVKDITATILDSDGNSIKNNEGEDIKVTTGSDGNYSFDLGTISVNSLNNYKIKFEYTDKAGAKQTIIKPLSELGCKFTTEESSSDTNLPNLKNTSKAQEVESDRSTVDNNYQSVTGTNNSNQSTVSTNNGSFNVNYTRAPITKSKNVKTLEDQLSGNTRNVNRFNDYENYGYNKVTATTGETGYGILGSNQIKTIRLLGLQEITDINCGLIQREQVNLSISPVTIEPTESTDIDNVEVIVNGYKHTYIYGAKSPNTNEQNYELEVTAMDGGYTREMYASDILGVDGDTCQVYITYKISIKNNSSTLSAKVDELINYHDAKFYDASNNDSDGKKDKPRANTTNNFEGSVENDDIAVYYIGESNGYIKEKMTFNNAQTIKARESTQFFVKYKLTNDAVVGILSNDQTLENIIEINKYTTYYGENTYYHSGYGKRSGVYASIDYDSAPGNATIGDATTYEDDTKVLPAIVMKLRENERTISGNVFEDIKGENGLGDGIYNDGSDNDKLKDNVVGGVTVELYKYPEDPETISYDERSPIFANRVGEIAHMAVKGEDGKYHKAEGYPEARTTSSADGSYSISGIAPGKYVLKFTYANGNVIYKVPEDEENSRKINNINAYKSTIITSDAVITALANPKEPSMWYKNIGEYSVAVDDKTTYDNQVQDVKKAYSAPMNIKFEMVQNDEDKSYVRVVVNTDGTKQYETVSTYAMGNMNFGIVEKDEQNYEVKKEVSHVKITLSDGQRVLIDGDPREQNIDYTKYLQNTPFTRANTVNMEIENNELIGATIEITYEISLPDESENTSIPKYCHTYEYYYFGNEPEDTGDSETTTDEGTVIIKKVIDYIDNDVVYAEGLGGTQYLGKIVEEGGHNVFKSNDGTFKIDDIDNKLIADVISAAKKYNNILILVNENEDKKATWSFKVSKLLAPSADDLEFDNYVEVLDVEGSTTDANHTGDFNPETEGTKIDSTYEGQTDYYAAFVTITSPTGANRNIVIFVVATISLVILAGGIWIIKTKIL